MGKWGQRSREYGPMSLALLCTIGFLRFETARLAARETQAVEAGGAAELVATVTDDQLTLESLSLGLSASQLLRALATFEAYERVYADGGAWLSFEAGCGMLPAPTEPIGCDANCLKDACESVIDRYYADVVEALAPLDEERATFELSGAANRFSTAKRTPTTTALRNNGSRSLVASR